MSSQDDSTSALSSLSTLDTQSRAELERFLKQEEEKAKLRSAVHTLTDKCFKQCVTGKISRGEVEKAEEGCLQNCVERWIDAQGVVLKNLGKGQR
ncbi:Tim10/DDP family zinc finger-domain-containing protein [Kalaharituber pfeilii]|nr:Tim10/DDP family zinc finger-domain-containing protein [Kalaharituber pfeilii]